MKWITQSSPSWQALASSWLITRFIDHQAEILFASEADLDAKITETAAIPFHIFGVEFSATREYTSFDRLLIAYRMNNSALEKMTREWGFVDEKKLTEKLEKAGLSQLLSLVNIEGLNDSQRLERGLKIGDAFYAWCKEQVLASPVVPRVDINRVL